jgi:hypothetical protein
VKLILNRPPFHDLKVTKLGHLSYSQVPNIRFTVARGLETLSPICGSNICNTHLRPVLEILSTDYDKDVQYYSLKALKGLNKCEELKDSNDI